VTDEFSSVIRVHAAAARGGVLGRTTVARVITDQQRRDRGLRTVAEILELAEAGTVVLDPNSVLIGKRVVLGKENVLYPGVVVECAEDAECVFGDRNTLLPGTYVSVQAGGSVVVGNDTRIGEGGARVVASGGVVTIGDAVRLSSGALVIAPAELGAGCQVLGQITAQDVVLAGGADLTHPDPDHRGAVLKGFGKARGLQVGVGEVVNGAGDFDDAPVERQRKYHPNAPRLGG
jgi:UDP-3-O-[3-hydroxymyristoyl] glucosamine N-acyltransferase